MLAQDYINKAIPDETIQVIISLGVIITCIVGSMIYSIRKQKKGTPAKLLDDENET